MAETKPEVAVAWGLLNSPSPLGPCVSLGERVVMLDLFLSSKERVAVPYSGIHVVKWKTVSEPQNEKLTFKLRGVEVIVTGYSLVDVLHAIMSREVCQLRKREPGSIRRDKTCPVVEDIEIAWDD